MTATHRPGAPTQRRGQSSPVRQPPDRRDCPAASDCCWPAPLSPVSGCSAAWATRQPRIHGILTDKALARPERRERLLTDVSDGEWEQAAQMTDADDYWLRVLAAD